MQRWRIQLFSGLRAELGERVVIRFRTYKTGALLAYLAFYHQRRHPRTALVEWLWPGDDPEQARLKLRIALSSLRRQLEPPGGAAGTVIIADRGSIGLNPDAVTTDVADFEAALQAASRARSAPERSHWLREAIETYRGELLPGYAENWLLPERHRLTWAYGEALLALAAERERTGDAGGALHLARRAAADDPLSEEAHYELIRLLVAGGRPETALREYEQYARRLSHELGFEPSSELTALIRPRAAGGTNRRPPPLASPGGGAERARLPPPSPSPSSAPSGLPGTATFLLVELLVPEGDLDASPQESGDATERLRACLSAETVRRGGRGIERHGSPWLAPFPRATDALAAALACQRAAAAMGLPVRMALHTGETPADPHEGWTLERTVQLLLAAHRDQVLCTAATAALLRSEGAMTGEIGIGDLGAYRLSSRHNEPRAPERLFHVIYPEIRGREFPPPAAEPARAGYLPLTTTRFFGREIESERLTELLLAPETRLITLSGPGGSGKTRLAIEVARRLRERFSGAVWFIPLADLRPGSNLAAAVATALGGERSANADPMAQLAADLAQAPTLLLLDNMEHLIEEGAAFVSTLLGQVPSLTCLLTSRRPLALPGERELPVNPLPAPAPLNPAPCLLSSTPPVPASITPDELAGVQANPSVAMFVDRAQATQADFQLTPRNAATIAAICRRLEGLPLALELAAARARMLSPQQMLDQLERPLDFLTSHRPSATPRHRALRAALDWSFQLLSPRLQRFFARLSAFRGGFTRTVAEAVGGESHALDDLTLLRTVGLLQTEEGEVEPRYRLLETLREYGWEQLRPEERARAARLHAEYYLSLAERGEPQPAHADPGMWLHQWDAEHDNFRAALAWAQSEGEAWLGLRLAAGLGDYWRRRGHLEEGIRWLTGMLTGVERDSTRMEAEAVRARALLAAARMIFDQGDCGRAEALAQQAAALFRHAGDGRQLAQALFVQGRAVSGREPPAARPYYEQSLALCRELGDQSGTALALTGLGIMAGTLKDGPEQRRYFTQALAIQRELGDRAGIGEALYLLGVAARDAGDGETALRYYEESLPLSRALSDKMMTALILQLIGEVAYPLGDRERARACFTESLILNRELGRWGVAARALVGLGDATRSQGEHQAARAYYEECLELASARGMDPAIGGSLAGLAHLSRAAGDWSVSWSLFARALRHFHRVCVTKATPPGSASAGLADCLEGLAHLLQEETERARGRTALTVSAARAVRLLGAASAVRSWTPWPRPTAQAAAVIERCGSLLRTHLAHADFSAAWDEGYQTPLPLVPDLLSDPASLA